MAASGGGDDASKKRSIVVMDMPVEFINRDILKTHFEQFGTVERLACSVSKKYAVIHFSTPEQAEIAAARGAMIRPDAPRLKIVTRNVGGGPGPGLSSSSQKPAAPSAATTAPPPPPSGRLVTRRKIVRNFGDTSGAATSAESPPNTSSMASSSHSGADKASSSFRSQAPLRSSVKISRPSPFLKKKPSFGDKSAKPGTSPAGRNPFALPARSLLSLDRRKKTVAQGESHKTEPSSPVKRGKMSGSGPGASTSRSATETAPQSKRPAAPQIKSKTQSRTEGQGSSMTMTSHGGESSEAFGLDAEQDEPQHISSAPKTSAVVDIDETTEDALLNEDEETVDEPDNNDYNDEDYDPDADEPDSQDTADATTEEEGEIHDDQDEDEEDGDAAFESPLKRAEMAAKSSSATAPSTSGGPFSFKLKPTSAAPPPELFKLPFTSPFSSGSAPKPFSSTFSGNQFGGTSSSSIFAGGSSTSTPQEKKVASSADKENKSLPKLEPSKETVTAPPKTEPPKKAADFSFASLSSSSHSFGSNLFDLSKKSSTSAGSSAAVEAKSATAAAAPSSSKASSSASSSAFLQAFLPKRINPPTTTMSSLPSTSKSTAIVPKALPQQPSSVPSNAPTPNPLLLTLYPDSSEAQELFSKKSVSVEERYRILEARDKLIRSRVPKTKVNVEFATKLIGTCPDMCPEKERYMRQFQRQLVSYETLPGQDFVVDHHKAIKAYSRSSADQEEPLPHELRPGSTLDFTMHYLLRFIVPLGDNPDENLSDWYNFLWDRTRSIRKDITQQQITDLTAVSLYEKCTRFHIHCASHLCELDVHSFDPKLNDENLMKCLQSLEHLYEDLRRRQVTCPSEPEFRAYQIIMNLNEGDALYNAQQLPSWILNSEQVQTALKLHHSIFTKNFVAFFKMVQGLPYMTACLLHRYFFQVRSRALRCFMKAHCTLPKYETAMPMSTLQRMLGYGTDQSLSFSFLCEAHGVHCDVDEGRVILKRKMFAFPDTPLIYRETYLVDSKLHTTVSEAVNGGPLPNIDFGGHRPHSSFSENGQLIPGKIVGGPDTEESRVAIPDFVPPDISTSSSRFQSKPAAFGAPPPFSFGSFQKQREPPPMQPPIPVQLPPAQPPPPRREIENVCQAVTSRMIDESVRKDVTQVSQAQIDEARRLQEEIQRKQLVEQIATRLSSEYADQIVSSQVDTIIRAVAASKIRQLSAVKSLSRSSAAIIMEENVMLNLRMLARTELQMAKESHHRLIVNLGRIFQRIRARFVLERWTRFSRKKIFEREREEEKRREELWNFPAIDSYSLSTKQVFKAFCGKSSAQPSLDKAEQLNKPVNNPNFRPKRKSDGEITDFSFETPNKLPRLASETSTMAEFEQLQAYQARQKDMWDFPPSNPYSRTNRQVLQAFCGSSSVVNLPVSPKMTTFGNKANIGSPSNSSSNMSNDPMSSFRIHKPVTMPSATNRVSEEIRSKANESISDFLQDIQSFVSQVKEEKEKAASLDTYFEGMESMDQTCSQLSSPSRAGFMESDDDDDAESDWMNKVSDEGRPGFLSGVFLEEDELLSKIRNFTREVKCEKAASWNTDTFLNDIELGDVL